MYNSEQKGVDVVEAAPQAALTPSASVQSPEERHVGREPECCATSPLRAMTLEVSESALCDLLAPLRHRCTALSRHRGEIESSAESERFSVGSFR